MTVWKKLCCGYSPWPCCLGNRIGVGDKEISLLMLGLDNAGKSCTAKSMVGDTDLSSVAPTVGFSSVKTKYKGYRVTIFDLGGSKRFRGIWPKYFHEVHGLIFVVDSADKGRNDEGREIFRDILRHDKVRGKPVLFLCNKSDLDDAQDEIDIVEALNVEQVVNEARCPTRVEPAVATKNQGLRVGFKWLVKSVIANYGDLAPRVEADIDLETRIQEKRRKELQKRMEERSKEIEESHEDQHVSNKVGFVPLNELKNEWNEESPPRNSPKLDESHTEKVPSQVRHSTAMCQSTDVVDLPNCLPSSEKLELEPISEPKKRTSLLKKLNRNGTTTSMLKKGRNLSIDSGGSVSMNSKPNSANSSVESIRDSQVIRAYIEC
ncbi:ADP-ribosylation factor-like protein 13B [Tigriopus californicus]|uniref:ADP-ribosylation factor-like protein 13B n=1 Tax=Tigriopus californicus TaxID=6832 RepID=UPI0027DAA36D|nr:ADP-ribosylation factor-like protein 13B [Tigriopus californicus]